MKNRFIFFCYIFVSALLSVNCQSIVNTVHNLSVSGPGTIIASAEQEICLFCHTPHRSKPDSPLWNKNDPGVFYDLYTSTTIQSVPGQPTGASLLCLSCHDGTIALGSVLSRVEDINFSGAITHLPPGDNNLSTDLSDDHPISFQYTSSLAGSDGQLLDPALLTYPVSLDNGYMQCTSCHDPHKNIYSDFLVSSTKYSELCMKCHNRDYWGTSSHNNSTANWNKTGIDPWQHTTFTSVAENACENCHNPHSAEGKSGLRNSIEEEINCLVCHNGNVASTNIANELNKAYTHNVEAYNLIHDPVESELVSTIHAECEDCHNPHAAYNSPASAPGVSGSLAGVKGVNLSGSAVNPAIYEYEICFRCHSSTNLRPEGNTTRQIEQTNTRFEFSPGNPSYHPVAAIGVNTDVPSLKAPDYSISSMIYCTDCHASDGITSPSGPHGSNIQSLLKYEYKTADFTSESPENYALCYFCHSRTSILNDESFTYHFKHIVEEDSPCNSCHDPHGISSTQGNSINNSHLINFDMDIVVANGLQNVRFEDGPVDNRFCVLRCHDKGHGSSKSY